MIKIILLICLIIFTTGCSKDDINDSFITPEITPDVTPEISPDIDVETDFEVDSDNLLHELLMSYIFINVTNISYINLPTEILGNEITWLNNSQSITSVSGVNITYYITANIGKYTKNFNITFKDGIVYEIYQQDLIFRYMFVNDSRKFGTSMNPDRIVFHNTANTASALNEVTYLNSSNNTSSTSFHFAVDDVGVYQAIPTNVYAHHAGNLEVNKKSIGVEIAKSLSNDVKVKDKAIFNAQKLIRLLQMEYDITNLYTHYDITGKHCPHDIIDRYGVDRFLRELQSYHIITI